MVLHISMVVLGLAAIAGGLPLAHKVRPPFDIAGALIALAGLVSALLGALLLAVPGFFQG
jgi:hypothetical protein